MIKSYQVNKMYKKIFISFLVPVLINFLVGCYSKPTIKRSDYIETGSSTDLMIVGSNVFITMNSGEEYTGELLSVRDSIMILCESDKVSEEEISDFSYPFITIKNHDIKSISIEGKKNMLVAIIFGGLGAGMGAAIGSNDGKEEKTEGIFPAPDFGNAGLGCFIGGSIGLLLGVIIGNNISDNEVVYEYKNSEEYDFKQLNHYSRYGDNEPEYLMKIK